MPYVQSLQWWGSQGACGWSSWITQATRSQPWLARQRGKIDAGLAALEGMLGNRPWLAGNSMSLADLAISCHVGFLAVRMPQLFPQDRYPNLARLWKNMEARESMKKTVPPPA